MKQINKNRLLRITLIYSVLLILLLACCWYLLQHRYSILTDYNTKIAQENLSKLEGVADVEVFLAKKIHSIFDSSMNSLQLKKRLELINKFTSGNLKYIIWTKDNNIEFKNFDSTKMSGSISIACQSFYDLQFLKKYNRKTGLPKDELKNIHTVFGHNLLPNYTNNSSQKRECFIIPDSNSLNNKLWIKTSRKFVLVVFLDFNKLVESQLLRLKINELELHSPSVYYAVNYKDKIVINNNTLKPLLFMLFNDKQVALPSKKYKNYNVISRYINDETIAFAFVDTHLYFKYKLMLLFSLLMVFIAAFMTCISYIFIINRQKNNVRIHLQQKLTGLFILFNLIPIVLLALLGHDYLVQLKKTEIFRIYSKAINYLEHADDLYLSEETWQIRSLSHGIEKIRLDLIKNGITGKNISKFLECQAPNIFRVTLVGSTTNRMATELGIQAENEKFTKVKFPNISNIAYSNKNKLSKLMISVSKLFVSKLNKKPILAKQATEFEFISKAFGYASPLSMTQAFCENNSTIYSLGLGLYRAPIFLYMFSLTGVNMLDYMLMCTWRGNALLDHYLARLYSRFNKNNFGLKVMIYFPNGRRPVPLELKKNKEICKFATHLQDTPNRNNTRTCLWKGKLYYLMGFKGQRVKSINYIGLYPCSKIDKIVNSKKHLFMLFGIVGFLISILFGLSVARQIMLPIDDLKLGINALKNYDFSYKIPNLGNDEFGNIAQIINETIEDMSELQKTESLNTKMFCNTGKKVRIGNSTLFGNASVLKTSGKDYLDVFLLENESKIGVIWGTIDKPGVASTLLAAYLRSCTIVCQNLEENTHKFVDKVSSLVHKINDSEEMQVITFQYFLFDTVTNKLDIANYGCKLPVIIRENQEQPINCKIGEQILENNDALIAFSPLFDEIINFDQYLFEARHQDPEAYYDKVINTVISKEADGEALAENSSLVILSVGEPT